MKYGLHRDLPFRPLYADGLGFQRPKLDDSRPLWTFSSEEAAKTLRKHLRHDAGGLVHIAPIRRIRERMKSELAELMEKSL